jgi:hypothetical protein
VKKTFIFNILMLVFFIVVLPSNSYSNDGVMGMDPDGVYPVQNKNIQMVSEDININLNDGKVKCKFVFKNTGPEETVLIGFPKSALLDGVDGEFIYEIENFKTWINNNEIENEILSSVDINKYITKTNISYYKDWYVFSVVFKENEEIEIYHEYNTLFGYDSLGMTFTGYILETGSLWNDKIEKANITFDYSNLVNRDNEFFEIITRIDSTSYKKVENLPVIDNYTVSYVFENFKPDFNINAYWGVPANLLYMQEIAIKTLDSYIIDNSNSYDRLSKYLLHLKENLQIVDEQDYINHLNGLIRNKSLDVENINKIAGSINTELVYLGNDLFKVNYKIDSETDSDIALMVVENWWDYSIRNYKFNKTDSIYIELSDKDYSLSFIYADYDFSYGHNRILITKEDMLKAKSEYVDDRYSELQDKLKQKEILLEETERTLANQNIEMNLLEKENNKIKNTNRYILIICSIIILFLTVLMFTFKYKRSAK